jgi:4a-hydroxytetrahydrobiopterin dehydratase
MSSLSDQRCIPCEGGATPLSGAEAHALLPEISEWEIAPDNKKLVRTCTFKDFLAAMSFVDQVADIAELEGHHPDMHISYNKVTLELTTHAIGGLSQNDFIVAAKINTLPQ